MRKKIIFIISLIFLLSLVYTSTTNAYYRNQYWECTRSGETSLGDFFGRFSPSQGTNGVCTKTCCILCVARNPISSCFGGNAQPMCSCSQGASADATPPVLTANSPANNNIYSKRTVYFNASVSERSKIEYKDNKQPQRGYKFLCNGCTGFYRQLNFNEGQNDITIKATDAGGNTDEERVLFMVDSKAPQISKTEPRNGKYGNGNFVIYYNEENLKTITLKYREGTNSQVTSIAKNDCESGLRKSCTFNVNNLQNGDLYYNFEVEDIAGKKVKSREFKIIIDTTSPVLTLDSSLTENMPNTFLRRIVLSSSVSEKVDLSYKDLNGNNRIVSLCRNCNSYNRNVNFVSGSHNLIIKAVDPAGNVNEKNLVFNIVNQ